ncbi:hypothetical protein CYMTET_29177 [Cymbomonas tetramitiformis]|uniref:Protein arginine N-methyltransferase domain-containing protein n=1 Tax=Cymbomonas tetramitiformis TaxID=36881 RepID=A0AAE0FLI0_9CHLO|nr:hypothetical protein CYMTET_29177 [Cymbomonas tetramitiformis]
MRKHEDIPHYALIYSSITFFLGKSDRVILSTSPLDPPTHWKQTVVMLGAFPKVAVGEGITCRMSLVQDILADEWDDLVSRGPERWVWTEEQSEASPEQAIALPEEGVADLMGASTRVTHLLQDALVGRVLSEVRMEGWRVELTHTGLLKARGAILAVMSTYIKLHGNI